MNGIKALKLASLLGLLLLGTGCSRLVIRTEIHTGDGLERPPTSGEVSQKLAAEVYTATGTFLGADMEGLAVEFTARWLDLQRVCPAVFPGDEDDFKASAKQALTEKLRQPFAGPVAELSARALELQERAVAAPRERGPSLLREAQALHNDLVRLVQEAREGARGMAEREAHRKEDAVKARYQVDQLKAAYADPKPANQADLEKLLAELKKGSGLPLEHEAQLGPAISILVNRCRARMGDLYAELGSAALRPLALAVAVAAPGVTFSLGDPNLARVVGDEAEGHWKEFVSDVTATTLLGRTEVVVRMQDVGQYHIKRVQADPSDVIRATMSTTSFAVKVLAAAYGVPAPVGGKPPPERTSLVQIEAELARLRRIEHTRLGHQGALFDQLIELAGRLRDQNGAAVAGVLDPQKALAGALVRKYAAGIESGEVLE